MRKDPSLQPTVCLPDSGPAGRNFGSIHDMFQSPAEFVVKRRGLRTKKGRSKDGSVANANLVQKTNVLTSTNKPLGKHQECCNSE